MKSVFVFIIAMIWVMLSQTLPAQCLDLSQAGQVEVLTCIAGKYRIPKSVSLRLKSSSQVGTSCFRRFIIEGSGDLNSWSLELFLSPDHHFISTELMDVRLDPKVEEIRRDQEMLKSLSAGSPPARGINDARVTIVVFSDFECPYCKSFEEVLSAELKKRPDTVKIIFRHFPLASHHWARKAAEAAACAQLQDSEAFWNLHDKIFANQDRLSAENMDAELLRIAINSRIDIGRYRQCMDNQMSLGLVAKYIKAASLYEINGTPTVFINGKRVEAVRTLTELDMLVVCV